MNRQVHLLLTVGLLYKWVHQVSSHGRLWDPPGRSTMWRRGYNTPINYQDNELFCGGFQHQVSLGYKCGLCGDPYDGVREDETGGKYATGTITLTYTQGQRTTFLVDLTASHKGYFEFKICPRDDPAVRETQECFNLHPVPLADGSGTKYYNCTQSGMLGVDVVLPADVTCDYCVLQWRYHAGNSWGTEPNGTSCIGCGKQEEFYGCSDIRILASGSRHLKDNETIDEENSVNKMTGSDGKPSDESHHDHNSTPGTSILDLVCRGVSGRTELDKWCLLNCKLGNCPSSHCECKEEHVPPIVGPPGCRATNAFADIPGYDKWCSDNCAAGHCPSAMCVCIK